MHNNWFTIVNPTSGNGLSFKKLNFIKKYFKKYEIPVTIVLTEYIHHEKILVKQALKEGYNKFISVGGDGTLHHIVNGIMQQNIVKSNQVKIGVIPVGTGNDWVKTYKISNKIEKAIAIIKKENTILQDIGKINILSNNNITYFNNLAGIGFDGYVVKRISSYKKLGSIAYLLGGLTSFFTYKKSNLIVSIGNNKIESKIFMISVGLCKYSGGGMQLTDYKNHKNGLFDITLIKNITLKKILLHIKKLYNGKIIHLKEVENIQEENLKIKVLQNPLPYIQADGELLGQGNLEINIIKNAIQFIVPNIKN
ncbi:MAG: diacylglycerol kinase family lipid kinase [Flavobacteriaceae bacterium]|nr:diacylglycerol kinase family lipid kinase [Flavobacteriaceae bacterium]